MGYVPPPLPQTKLELTRQAYVNGRIDVDEFEARVGAMLRDGTAASRPWLKPPPKPTRVPR